MARWALQAQRLDTRLGSLQLRIPKRRGLRGVQLVISDAHECLKAAIRRVFAASWQRCRAHWMRNTLAYVPNTQQSMVAASPRQTFLQPDQASQMLRRLADQLRPKWMNLATFIDDSESHVLSFLDFPEPHCSKVHRTDEIDKSFSAGSLVHVEPVVLAGGLGQPILSVGGTVAKRAARFKAKAAGPRTAHLGTQFGARCGTIVLHRRLRGEVQG